MIDVQLNLEEFVIAFLYEAALEAEHQLGFYDDFYDDVVDQRNTVMSFCGWAERWLNAQEYINVWRPMLKGKSV